MTEPALRYRTAILGCWLLLSLSEWSSPPSLASEAQTTVATPVVEWTFQCDSPIYSSPVAADLTDAPGLEILVASSSERKVLCLSSKGERLWMYDDFTLRVTSTPTVADLDGDGGPEILITTRSDGVVCLSSEGKPVWKSPSKGGIPWGSATVANSDRDGPPEIYWVTESGVVEAHASDGAGLWVVENQTRESYGPLAVGNTNEDLEDEIVAAVGSSVLCLDRHGKESWRFEGLSSFNSGPVLSDLDGDRKPEALTASSDGVLYCLEGESGMPIWTHRTFRGRVDTSLAVGDLDGDGLREVLYGDGFGNLYCLTDGGVERWSYKAGDWIESAPVLGDIDGDGEIEMVFGSADGDVYCLSAGGELEWRFQTGLRVSASPTLCDCDEDGILEILVASHSGILYCLSAGGERDPDKIPWPMKRYDLAHTASDLSK